MTPISYEESSQLLQRQIDALRHAVYRGVLTRYPRRLGKQQPLIKEQVELFKGKQLSLSSLSVEELKIWEENEKLAAQERGKDAYENSPWAALKEHLDARNSSPAPAPAEFRPDWFPGAIPAMVTPLAPDKREEVPQGFPFPPVLGWLKV